MQRRRTVLNRCSPSHVLRSYDTKTLSLQVNGSHWPVFLMEIIKMCKLIGRIVFSYKQINYLE